MIDKENITIDWINKISKENRNADKILVEKVIRALLLLEGLVKEKLSFTFKGGTALMLLLGSTKRLSTLHPTVATVEKFGDKPTNFWQFLTTLTPNKYKSNQ